MPNHLTGSPNGGMTVYYIQPTNRQKKVTAFPKVRFLFGDLEDTVLIFSFKGFPYDFG